MLVMIDTKSSFSVPVHGYLQMQVAYDDVGDDDHVHDHDGDDDDHHDDCDDDKCKSCFSVHGYLYM